MELLQRILISIQAACFPDFSLITNNYGLELKKQKDVWTI